LRVKAILNRHIPVYLFWAVSGSYLRIRDGAHHQRSIMSYVQSVPMPSNLLPGHWHDNVTALHAMLRYLN
jgi:hypothetical protein